MGDFLTLWVVSLVKSEQLMANEIVAWRKSGWDGTGPGEMVDNSITRPDTGVLSSGDQSGVIDLDYKSCKLAT